MTGLVAVPETGPTAQAPVTTPFSVPTICPCEIKETIASAILGAPFSANLRAISSPYSPAAGTGLSSHELNQPGCYRDVKDTTVTALFSITDLAGLSKDKNLLTAWGKPYFVAWTTTPWTLPSNIALCVGPKIDYVAVRTYNPYTAEKVTLLMAEARVNAYLKQEGEMRDEEEMPEYKKGDKLVPYRIVAHYTGEQLVGMHYQQLMPWVKPCEKLGGSGGGVRQGLRYLFLNSVGDCTGQDLPCRNYE